MGKRDAKRLVKEAYEFGYFVGYKGHSDWAEWVRSTKEDLYARAEELGVYQLVKEAYGRGRIEGAKRREEEIHLSLIEKGRIEGEREEKPLKPAPPEEERTEEETMRVEFARFIETTRILTPPDLLDSLRFVKPPKMLHLGDKE
ncbi:hypothetical protein [Thermococcus sp. JdF3]|uniref:hypothetical protein n=1 Tax=Thermococcus sp. JdF3 TaxID=1638258 RepID=UPI00143C16B1|nr:hypothetical protein [Thermococcus sp. JdF3]NJE00731.1 hypothetical protein [Thermococcus sp. JdF3]